MFDDIFGKTYWAALENVITLCKEALEEVVTPIEKPYFVDITDAGPGAGITNHEVGFRIAQEIQLCNYDYYIRIHNAPNDSSSNEVEHIQSSVGDAGCDRNPLIWEHHKKFEGMTEEGIGCLSLAEIEKLEYDRMHDNAIKVIECMTTQ